MTYVVAFLFCWLVVPLLFAPKKRRATYPHTWTLRADHGRGAFAGAVLVIILWLVR